MTVVRGIAEACGLFSIAIVAIAVILFGLVWLVQRARELRLVPRRGLAPQAWVRDDDGAIAEVRWDENGPSITRYQRDEGDETDIVPEGLGPTIVRRHHSPTTPLAYLEEQEWQLWTSVIAESAR